MSITAISPAAAARLRALSTQAAFTAQWRLDVPSAVVPTSHNSIATALRTVAVPTTGVMSAEAGNDAFGAAKQAAPPRGVPR
jgi:hypothetical protein